MTALIRAPFFRSAASASAIRSGSMFKLSASTSTNTGRAPTRSTVPMVAKKV